MGLSSKGLRVWFRCQWCVQGSVQGGAQGPGQLTHGLMLVGAQRPCTPTPRHPDKWSFCVQISVFVQAKCFNVESHCGAGPLGQIASPPGMSQFWGLWGPHWGIWFIVSRPWIPLYLSEIQCISCDSTVELPAGGIRQKANAPKRAFLPPLRPPSESIALGRGRVIHTECVLCCVPPHTIAWAW